MTGNEGNHGEDVKELYFYLDSTPTHSYMKYLYKYPQAAFPYQQLIEGNRRRGRSDPEYELADTGAFADNRYFDIQAEYAKGDPENILIRIQVTNRGPEEADLHLLPTIWFRNTWSWGGSVQRPSLKRAGPGTIELDHPSLGRRWLAAEGNPELLFTENETNTQRLDGVPVGFAKDGINDYVVNGIGSAINPELMGTKAAARYSIRLAPGETRTFRLRLHPANAGDIFGEGFDRIFADRLTEADEFYATVIPANCRPTPATSCGRHSRDCSGPNSFTTTWSRTGWRATPPTRLHLSSDGLDATANGVISTTPTSSPCRISGNIRGTRRGTWRSIACRLLW